ncbi:MAG: hypothetical protein OZ913_06660 [Ignavibacteriaceae bacterium]|jgi:hypothetical protein|nr:MAG: hypothetical protein EDM69_06640 [Chlorobiota bacterium]KXK06305.1 MAG: hypothetical protein UZ04_CHB001000307 [Chlorobi bacterium OLB4]MBV6399181.1 hypothetical protein [Ignavibacteria bacterium]MCC6885372.1 hypothetical protein [Ignavibacteriales bacterium]MCE7953615.1 hypothetical protein [Chlorobi bacterium CHB7]MDL1887495.1 hypothetical protein [Ignavibacteria bacterium CHB1]MEB2329969.1 hypothetical protein [Ignavibacteriaceae bacterium]OQY78382.1 MAG: hypothetical protein B6D4
MTTRRILAISSNDELISFIKIKALTLTKLNHQITVEFISEVDDLVQKSSEENSAMVIIDLAFIHALDAIVAIRSNSSSTTMKIIGISPVEFSKEQKSKIFKSGCDSIMTLLEFHTAIDNIFKY